LIAQKEVGASRVAVGLLANDRGIPRGHMQVKDSNDQVFGETTSGTFSPTLQKGIALALVQSSVQEGDVLSVDVRGRALSVTVTKPPFVQPSTK
jgi:aminomethyltransferase